MRITESLEKDRKDESQQKPREAWLQKREQKRERLNCLVADFFPGESERNIG